MASHEPARDTREKNLATGQLVSAFRINEHIGTGGMGWVFRAEHVLEGHVVALKVLRADQLTQDRSIDRMMREATVLASVAHPGIPRFYECGVLPDRRPWIAMELVEGASLAGSIARGPVRPLDVLDVIAHVSDVLASAHAHGVTHRDIKPDNIILTPDDVFPVRLIDWGIAHYLAGARYTNMNEAIGTPTYMAPEQARGGPTDGHCDVYGLGVVAYHALSGRPPFLGGTSVEILVQHLNRPLPALAPRCSAPRELIDLVEKMLIKNFEDRPNALEVRGMANALREELGGPPIYDDSTIEAIPVTVHHERSAATKQFRTPRYDDDDV
jgi:serine/threonine protein kinase